MAIQREIWQRTIVEGLFADNSFMSKAVNDDVYVNEGKSVHIPNAGAPSKVEINRASLPASASARTDVDVKYDLDELTTDPVYIPNADTVELSYNKRNSIISQDRQELIEKAAENILYRWAPDSEHFVKTTGAATKAHTEKATGNRKSLTKADILELMTQFNLADVPMENRYLLLDAVMYSQLLKDLSEADKFAFLQCADMSKGILGELYSFKVLKPRSRVIRYTTAGVLSKWSTTGVTTDNAAGLAWQQDCLSRALGEVKVFDSTNNPMYYGDVYSFLVRCGGSIRRNDKKGVLALVQDVAV